MPSRKRLPAGNAPLAIADLLERRTLFAITPVCLGDYIEIPAKSTGLVDVNSYSFPQNGLLDVTLPLTTASINFTNAATNSFTAVVSGVSADSSVKRDVTQNTFTHAIVSSKVVGTHTIDLEIAYQSFTIQIGSVSAENVVAGPSVSASTIMMMRSSGDQDDDIWVNVPNPDRSNCTQFADPGQTISMGGAAPQTTLVFDSTNGNPLGSQLVLEDSSFTTTDLNIPQGATVRLLASGAPLEAGTLEMGLATTLDVQNSLLTLSYGVGSSPNATIRSLVQKGLAGEAGILSTTLTANHTVGYRDDSGNKQELVRATLFGDADVNGTVNFSDLLLVAQNYGHGNTEWTRGDFNYDGSTNFADLLALAQNYNK